jgi:hypothetical protein
MPTYKITELPHQVTTGGATDSIAYDINEAGKVAGLATVGRRNLSPSSVETRPFRSPSFMPSAAKPTAPSNGWSAPMPSATAD